MKSHNTISQIGASLVISLSDGTISSDGDLTLSGTAINFDGPIDTASGNLSIKANNGAGDVTITANASLNLTTPQVTLPSGGIIDTSAGDLALKANSGSGAIQCYSRIDMRDNTIVTDATTFYIYQNVLNAIANSGTFVAHATYGTISSENAIYMVPLAVPANCTITAVDVYINKGAGVTTTVTLYKRDLTTWTAASTSVGSASTSRTGNQTFTISGLSEGVSETDTNVYYVKVADGASVNVLCAIRVTCSITKVNLIQRSV